MILCSLLCRRKFGPRNEKEDNMPVVDPTYRTQVVVNALLTLELP